MMLTAAGRQVVLPRPDLDVTTISDVLSRPRSSNSRDMPEIDVETPDDDSLFGDFEFGGSIDDGTLNIEFENEMMQD